MTKKHTYHTTTSEETTALGHKLAPDLQGKIVYLQGELGAGKTTFVRGVAAGLGLKDRVVSPTFTYQRQYGKGSKKIHHFDLYRIENGKDPLLEDELHELIHNSKATLLIEWPDKLPTHQGREAVTIKFSFGENESRIITLTTGL